MSKFTVLDSIYGFPLHYNCTDFFSTPFVLDTQKMWPPCDFTFAAICLILQHWKEGKGGDRDTRESFCLQKWNLKQLLTSEPVNWKLQSWSGACSDSERKQRDKHIHTVRTLTRFTAGTLSVRHKDEAASCSLSDGYYGGDWWTNSIWTTRFMAKNNRYTHRKECG